MPEFTWPVRVYYEDTDASGVVYHANYLRFFERARTEWVRSLGIVQDGLRREAGFAFTVANLEVRFIRPARLDDDLEVTVVIEHARRASIVFTQELRRVGGGDQRGIHAASPHLGILSGDGGLLSTARVRVGCVDVANFRPCPLPEALMKKIEQAGLLGKRS